MGMGWYSENQWDLLRQVSSDADRLEKTYVDWLRVAEAKYDELTKKGTHVVKVPIDVADMAVWCREMGRKNSRRRRPHLICHVLPPTTQNSQIPQVYLKKS